MTSLKIAQRLVWLLLTLTAMQAHACKLTIYTSFLPDYMINTAPTLEQSTGLMTEIAAGAFKAAHLCANMAPAMPWPRAQAMAMDQPGAVLVVLARTNAREKHWRWLASMYTDILYGYTIKGRPVYSSMDDIRARRPLVAALTGTAPVSLLESMGIATDTSPDNDDNFMKLKTGKVDLVLLQRMGSDFVMESLQQGRHKNFFSTTTPDLRRTPVLDVPLWVVTSLKTPDAEAQQLADALQKFKHTTAYQDVIKKYQHRLEDVSLPD